MLLIFDHTRVSRKVSPANLRGVFRLHAVFSGGVFGRSL
jgi:hypothetical protein